MQLNLAIDSGGTSVRGILYDQEFLPVGKTCVGSMRQNTTSKVQINQNIQTFHHELFKDAHPVLSRIFGIVAEAMKEFVLEHYTADNISFLGEDVLGLRAAAILGDGMLAVAGTGSKIYALVNGKATSLGGYGAMISDEGSGYWIGRAAFDAAIKSCEGRDAKTLLEELLCRKLGTDSLRKGIRSVYSMEGISPTAFIASCASLVSDAAFQEDEAALHIIKRAGHSLGEQACALARLENIPDSVPLTISGSVWKGHPGILREFIRTVKEKMPGREIVIPKFEPIVGAVIAHFYELHGSFTRLDQEKFASAYADYLYILHNDIACIKL